MKQVRMAGLLRDLGHSALFHAVEGVLSRNPEIQPIFGNKHVLRHEEFTRDIISAHPFGDAALRGADRYFCSTDDPFREVAEIASGGKLPLGQIIAVGTWMLTG